MAYYDFKKASGGVPEDYIYNVGPCAFNSGHKHTANTKIKFKAEVYTGAGASSGYGQCFGARNGNFRNNAMGLFGRFNASKYCYYRTGEEAQGNESPSNVSGPIVFFPTIFEVQNNTAQWYAEDDPLTVHNITGSNMTIDGGIAPLAIFAANGATQADGWNMQDPCLMKLFYFEIYENAALIKRFVPAFHNSQYCLYDEISDVYVYDLVNNGANVRGYIN